MIELTKVGAFAKQSTILICRCIPHPYLPFGREDNELGIYAIYIL